jgi:hypothetical protein
MQTVMFTEPGALVLMGGVLLAAAQVARRISGNRSDEASLRSARWHFRRALAAQPKPTYRPIQPPPLHPAQIEFLRRQQEAENSRRPWGSWERPRP